MHHSYDDIISSRYQVHRTAHAFHHFARHFPIRQIALFGNFHATQNSHIDVIAADHGKTCFGSEYRTPRLNRNGLLAGIDHVSIFFSCFRKRTNAQEPIFRLQDDFPVGRNVVRHARRDTNSQIHIIAILNFLRDARSDPFFFDFFGAEVFGNCLFYMRRSMFDGFHIIRTLKNTLHINARRMDLIGIECSCRY